MKEEGRLGKDGERKWKGERRRARVGERDSGVEWRGERLDTNGK